MTPSEDNTITAALKHYGVEHQVDIAKEEAAEFILALSHYFNRGRGSLEEVCEEIADLSIMVEQMKRVTNPLLVEHYRKAKLLRLSERIKEATNE